MSTEKLKFFLMVGVVAVLAVFLFKLGASYITWAPYQQAAAMV